MLGRDSPQLLSGCRWTPGHRFSPYQLIPKTEQPQDLQAGQGRHELGRSSLGNIEPLLHCQGLICPLFVQHPGDVVNRHLRLFLTDDFHNLISGDGDSVLPGGRVCREQIPVGLGFVLEALVPCKGEGHGVYPRPCRAGWNCATAFPGRLPWADIPARRWRAKCPNPRCVILTQNAWESRACGEPRPPYGTDSPRFSQETEVAQHMLPVDPSKHPDVLRFVFSR